MRFLVFRRAIARVRGNRSPRRRRRKTNISRKAYKSVFLWFNVCGSFSPKILLRYVHSDFRGPLKKQRYFAVASCLLRQNCNRLLVKKQACRGRGSLNRTFPTGSQWKRRSSRQGIRVFPPWEDNLSFPNNRSIDGEGGSL